ncbi:STAS/SEC14 domain-containing protein [Myxosarcina sp. GI1]|uniref:STAS/SEC14 domain-containing protein n=1 Tax=Myxosarcina sp. GI1 TaxID=1541065 RepID=UPI000691C89B|nr:STAS/SEC14 domain-containing protein [Myxosarcina sp. GI1]
MSESSGNVVGIKVSEQLTEQDYQTLVPLLEKAIGEHEKIRLLRDMDDFEGWSLDALWQDLKFDSEHKNNIERLALVGDKQWEKWISQSTKLFFEEAKYFDRDRAIKAWNWLRA